MKKQISVILLGFSILWIAGCGKKLDTPSIVDESLPTVGKVRTLAGQGQIALEWTPNYDDSISGYQIFRSNPLNSDSKLELIKIIEDRYSSHYVDKKLSPETSYTYGMRTYIKDNRVSQMSELSTATTETLIDSVSFAKAIMGLPQMIKLIWKPHPNISVDSYIIERNELGKDRWSKIAEIKGRLNAEYLDKNLKNNQIYKYRIFVKTNSGVISKPSNIMEARTKPLPPIVEGLKASRDLPKKIIVSWEPSPKSDISHYNVYSAPMSSFFYTFKAKTKETSFEDLINKNSNQVYYKITAVDNYGLESKKQDSPVAGRTLSSPQAPSFSRAGSNDGFTISLAWSDSDSRAVKYEITREGGDKTRVFKDILGNTFLDSEVMSGFKYTYVIRSIDKFGLISEKSKKVSVKLPE